MFWFGTYAGVAALVAALTFVAAGWLREEHVAAPDHSGAMSALAGAMWPVLLIGLSELAVICWASHGAKHPPPRLSPLSG